MKKTIRPVPTVPHFAIVIILSSCSTSAKEDCKDYRSGKIFGNCWTAPAREERPSRKIFRTGRMSSLYGAGSEIVDVELTIRSFPATSLPRTPLPALDLAGGSGCRKLAGMSPSTRKDDIVFLFFPRGAKSDIFFCNSETNAHKFVEKASGRHEFDLAVTMLLDQ
jgi:hypothetical protein